MALKTSNSYVDKLLSELSAVTTPAQMHTVSRNLLRSFHAALSVPTSSRATMLPSHITTLPTALESGSALSIDLGGSTLRCSHLSLLPSSPPVVHARTSVPMTDATKRLRATAFFDHVAATLLSLPLPTPPPRALGVAWSFPLKQTGLAHGEVQKMGKGYAVYEDIVNTDLALHIERALDRTTQLRGVRVTALMNDTEATMLAAAAHSGAGISVICGTGMNAAVVLPDSWFGGASAIGVRVVNTEASMFGGDGVLPAASVDRQLDAQAEHPGFQPLEQMLSGRYLGELVRLAVVGAMRTGELTFVAHQGDELWERFSLSAESAAGLEKQGLSPAMLAQLLGVNASAPVSEKDVEVIGTLARTVAQRAAIYLAITIYTLYRLQLDGNIVSVGADGAVRVAYCGAVVEKHHSIRRVCQETLDTLVETETETETEGKGDGEKRRRRRIILEVAEDSGLVGAGVGAVVNVWNKATSKSRL